MQRVRGSSPLSSTHDRALGPVFALLCAGAAGHAAGRRDGGTLLAVTHGGTARAALGLLLELPDASWGRFAPLGNTCWSVLVEASFGWRLERHNTSAGPLVGPVVHGSFEARAKP